MKNANQIREDLLRKPTTAEMLQEDLQSVNETLGNAIARKAAAQKRFRVVVAVATLVGASVGIGVAVFAMNRGE